jgi:hypothetical protein
MRKRRLATAVGGYTLALLTSLTLLRAQSGQPAPAPSPADIFTRRIAPIFNSPDPSSCTACHLAGVDLKNYILPTSEKTFLSLRDQGLIDLDNPAKSKILALIAMGESQPPKGARLIRPEVAKAEHDAFAAWITACAKDPALRTAPRLRPAELAAPSRPAAIIRHARTDPGGGILASFERNVWSQRLRCAACHTESGSEYARLSKTNGDIAWIGKTSAETLQRLLEKQLINPDKPTDSLLLAKPTMAVKHGGGQKMEIGDAGYKMYRTFLEEYAQTAADAYRAPADLPAAPALEHFGSELWLKVDHAPAAWNDQVAQIRVFAFDPAANTWEKEPLALSDRRIATANGDTFWQHSLILQAPANSDRAKRFAATPVLPPGRYLVKIYLDKNNKRAKDWHADLTEADLAAQTEYNGPWANGYGKMTIVNAAKNE